MLESNKNMTINNKTGKFLEIKDTELNDDQKDECKLLISDYLQNNRKQMKASNVNQLYFIIDYLIDYLKSKEKLFIDRVSKRY